MPGACCLRECAVEHRSAIVTFNDLLSSLADRVLALVFESGGKIMLTFIDSVWVLIGARKNENSCVYNCNIIGQYATDDESEDTTADYWIYGINTMLGISYYSEALSMLFVLGYKYQFYHYLGQDGSDNEKNDGENDRFHGIVFSAVYIF